MKKLEIKLAGIKFKTRRGNEYFYDDNTGVVFYCPEVLWVILNLYNNNSRAEILEFLSAKYLKKDIQNYYDLINRWISKQRAFFFVEDKMNCVSPSENDLNQYISNNCFRQLILNISEECNLRCRYCIYSDAYLYTRSHNKSQMNFSTAKKAIDYYFTMFKKVWRRNPYRKPMIGFYGGEPLLNFSLIKETIDYIKFKFPEFKERLFFNISTNGTLLTESVIDYLVSNDVTIAVSLDGDENENDRLRVDKNGSGTFSKVMKNIQKLKSKYPEYSKGVIQSCYDWDTDLARVKNFFNKNFLNKSKENFPSLVRTGGVTPFFTKYYKQYDETDKKNFNEQMHLLEEEYFQQVINGEKKYTNYLDYLLGMNCNSILYLQTVLSVHLPFLPYTATCVPGEKLCVRYDGTYHICERINHHFPIGDIEHGLNIKKIKNIIKLYNQQIADNCHHCPIKRLCTMCFCISAAEDGFIKDPSNCCESNIKFVKKQLSYIYSILEENPEAFEGGIGTYYKEWVEPDINL